MHVLLLAALVVIAVAAPLIAPYNPVRVNSAAQLLPPSAQHWFGTDGNGMDVFSRVVWGARVDLLIPLMGVLVGILAGALLGSFGGYLGGFVDDALSRLAEVIQSMPTFLLALMIVAVFGRSDVVLVGIVAFSNLPIFMKLSRSVASPLRGQDFVAAANCAGLGSVRVVLQHVLPNSIGPLGSQFSVSCGYAIQILAGLSFLGLGIPIPRPEWGSMIQSGAADMLYGQWWVALFPGLAVLLAVIAFDGIGRQLAERYIR